MKKIETSKVFMCIFGIACITWITMCIMLNYQDLAKYIISTVLMSLIAYFGQARFGKYHEEKNKVNAEIKSAELFQQFKQREDGEFQ